LSYCIGRHHTFNKIGRLIVGIDCLISDSDQDVEISDQENFRPVNDGQADALITDSPYCFAMEGFVSLVGVHDSTQWRIQGLPAEAKAAAVVSRDSTKALSERELLCRGFQYSGEAMRTFCSASDEQLDNVLVLELIDGIPGELIPSASLIRF